MERMRLYIRGHNDEGKRTWTSVGHISPVTLDNQELVLFIQIAPGKVYHARMTLEELILGDKWTPVLTEDDVK